MNLPDQTCERISPTTEPTTESPKPGRIPNGLTFRLEYVPDDLDAFADLPRPAPLKNWDRVFEVSDKITLEQFAAIILDLLALVGQ